MLNTHKYLPRKFFLKTFFLSTDYCLLSARKGFTLIEVMVTVAILSLGTLLIQQGLLRSSDILNHYNNQLAVEGFLDEAVWDARETLLFSEEGSQKTANGSFTESGRNFDWSVETKPVPGTDQLYFIRLNTSWLEGNKPVNFSKTAYVTANKQAKF